MKLTIIPADKAVYKDNICYFNLTSLSDVPSNVHALQWKDSQGWLEFNDGTSNELISDLPSWVNNISIEWDAKRTEELNNQALLEANLTESTLSQTMTDAQRIAIIVNDRNIRLLASDWTQLPDVVALHDSTWINNWKTYRQALRDLPATIDINNPAFPVPPL